VITPFYGLTVLTLMLAKPGSYWLNERFSTTLSSDTAVTRPSGERRSAFVLVLVPVLPAAGLELLTGNSQIASQNKGCPLRLA